MKASGIIVMRIAYALASASIIALVKDFAAKVEANKGDPVAIQEIVDSFRADNDVLAAAVIEHTPAAPPA